MFDNFLDVTKALVAYLAENNVVLPQLFGVNDWRVNARAPADPMNYLSCGTCRFAIPLWPADLDAHAIETLVSRARSNRTRDGVARCVSNPRLQQRTEAPHYNNIVLNAARLMQPMDRSADCAWFRSLRSNLLTSIGRWIQGICWWPKLSPTPLI